MIDERASTPGQNGQDPVAGPPRSAERRQEQNASQDRGQLPEGVPAPAPGQDPGQAQESSVASTRSGSADPGQNPGPARLAEMQAKFAALQEQYLRAVAETENVRRRSQEDVARARKYGIETFAESLLPVRDSLELALNADAPSVENLKEGVDVTLRQLTQAFEKNRLVQIDPRGQRFDPNLHQAITVVPGDSVKPAVAPNHVVSVLQKGYLINDRVLRPALVTVAQA